MANQPKNYKKFVATAATATLVASAIVPVASAASFSDIEGNTHADAIKALSDAGIIKGYEDGTFKPNAEINRGQTVKLLGRWLETKGYKVPGNWNTVQRFNDLPVNAADQELVKYAALVKDAGVFNGSNGNLNYNQPMQRQQMALVLVRAIKTVEGIDLIKEYKAAGYTSKIKDLDKAYSTENVEAITALEYAKITVVENFNPTSAITRGQFASFLNRTINYEAPVAKVVSVSAINAAQLQIKFNKAVDKDTVVDADGTLKNGVLTVTKVSGTGSVTVGDTSLATLSEDGKTLTVTAAAGAFNNINFVVTTPKDTIKTTDGKYVAEYTSNVLVANDATAPVVTNIEKRTASQIRVYFSEPLLNEGSWTFKFADGTSANVTVDASNKAKGYVDLTINAGIQAGKEITATVIGAKDYAGNLVNPNPFTVNFSKGQLDGVKPTVSSVTTNGLTTFEVKFSEEVQGLTAADISIDGVARTDDDGDGVATGTEAIVTQDTTDKTKYTVTVAQQSAGLHTIAIAANAVNDLSGEQNEAYSKVVEFKADTTAPKLVSSQVKKDENGYEYLHLTFDEAVTKGTVNALTATKVKDYVTSTGTIDLSAATVVPNTNNKEYKVKLADVTFGGAALEAGATYTVTLTGGFSDSSGNALGTTKVSFVRGTDTLTAAQSVTSVTKVVGNPSEVKVTFAQPVDGATATNVANYNISGVVIEKAEIRAGEPNVVYLTLKSGSNTLSGERNVTIYGVKTKDGVAMTTPYTGTVSLDENVPPTFTAALTAPDTITLTFSENVTGVVEATPVADFKVLVDGVDVTTLNPAVTVTEGGTEGTKTYTLTLSRPLSPAEYAKTITVEPATGLDVVDANNNSLSFTSVTVTK